MKLAIGIKALNEEKNIAAAIQSALAVLDFIEGEVILADSGSDDATIEIASKFQVRIVQLSHRSDRSCGAGAQLAYQYTSADYLYLLDADMVLNPQFVVAAIGFLEAHPEFAGIGGCVREKNLFGHDFQIRAANSLIDNSRVAGVVDRLEQGGLYRTAAIRAVGYFADRNLHSFEELELALRLRRRGWKLARIDVDAVDHFGYKISGYKLLWRRLRTGYAFGVGEVMRACWSNRQFFTLLKELNHVRVCVCVVLWWFLICGAAAILPLAAVSLLILPLGYLCVRRRSVQLGAYSLAAWNVSAVGMICGLMQRRLSPTLALAAIEFKRTRVEP